jgi:hypothetical protein
MHGNLPRLPKYGGRGVEVARLVRVGHENVVPEHAGQPHEIPAARTPGPGETPENDAGRTTARPVRVKHAARHARSSDARPRHRTSLSIRSAERRRWAADLTGPGSGGLVIYGLGGIGKSTLAAQIATRVSRLQSGRVVAVVSGEVSASAPWPAETDFIVLDNFDDNLSQDSGRWTVRDPELAARLDRQAADHLPASVQPRRNPPRSPHLSPARAADPLRRRRAHHLAPRDPAARRRRTRSGVAADRRSPDGHGIPGPAPGPRRALPGPGPPDRGCDHGRDRYTADRADRPPRCDSRADHFGGRGPGESPGPALRTAEIAAPAASARRMLAFVRRSVRRTWPPART